MKEELEEDVKDCEETLRQDEEILSRAKLNVDKSKVALAEAIINLHKCQQKKTI